MYLTATVAEQVERMYLLMGQSDDHLSHQDCEGKFHIFGTLT